MKSAAPPTRRLVMEGTKVVARGEIPTVVVSKASRQAAGGVEPTARGQPP